MIILNYPNPLLKRPARTVIRVTEELRALAAEMVNIMISEKGVGLAANQVGLPCRMITIRDENGKGLVLINPVVEAYGRIEENIEGCLSFPGMQFRVKRPKKCRLQGWSLYGDYVNEELSGFMSRVVQHEVDHLDGRLVIDRISEAAKIWVRDELRLMETIALKTPQPFDNVTFQSINKSCCGS